MQRLCRLVMIAVLILIMTACGGFSYQAGGTNSAHESTEPFTINMMANLFTEHAPTDRIKEMLEDKTGTRLEISWVPVENYFDKLNTAYATNMMPQVVYLKNQSTYRLIKNMIHEGHFWDIGPYLDQFPNLNRLKRETLTNLKVDGKLYTLYLGRSVTRQGVIYRKDWADRLGIEAPANIDELYDMLKRFTVDDPDRNGLADTVGLSDDRSDLVYGAFKTVASYFGTPNYWGVKDGELLPEFMFSEYINTMNYFRKLAEKGYMNHDFSVASKVNQWNLFTSGKAGVYIGSLEDVLRLHQELVLNNPAAELAVQSLISGPDGQKGAWAIPGYGNVVLFAKSSIPSEQALKRILKFYDDMMAADVSNLLFWGVEGEHYSIQDGRAKETIEKTLINEVRDYKGLLIGEPENNGRLESYHQLPAAAKAEQLIKLNEQYRIDDPTTTLYSETETEKGEALQELINDATYRYILGLMEEEQFEEVILNWRKQGGDQIIKEYNADFKRPE